MGKIPLSEKKQFNTRGALKETDFGTYLNVSAQSLFDTTNYLLRRLLPGWILKCTGDAKNPPLPALHSLASTIYNLKSKDGGRRKPVEIENEFRLEHRTPDSYIACGKPLDLLQKEHCETKACRLFGDTTSKRKKKPSYKEQAHCKVCQTKKATKAELEEVINNKDRLFELLVSGKLAERHMLVAERHILWLKDICPTILN